MKRIIPVILALVFVFLLAACGSSGGDTNSGATLYTTETPETTETSSFERYDFDNMADLSWAQAYRDYLYDISTEQNESGRWFALAYIDDDEIPELLVSEGYFHFAGVQILNYDKESGNVTGEDNVTGVYGAILYEEGTGKVLVSDGHQGVYATAIETYSNGQLVSGDSFTTQVNDLFDASKGFESLINDETVDEETFDKEFLEKIPEKIIAVGGYDENITGNADFIGCQELTPDSVEAFFEGIGNGKTYSANVYTSSASTLLESHKEYIEEMQ